MNTEKNNIRLLLIDVDKEYSEMLSSFLSISKRAVFDTVCSHSFEDAVERLGQDFFDAVLADLSFAGGKAADAVKKICTLAGSMPVILFSAASDEKENIEAVRNGVADCVNKGDCRENIELAVLRAIERKGYEERIRNSREELAGVIASAPVMMVITDADGKVVLTNPAVDPVFRTFGRAAGGNTFGGLLRCINSGGRDDGCGRAEKCDECMVRKIIKDTVEKGESEYKKEIVYTVEKNGKQSGLTISVSSTAIRIKGRECCLLIIDDITEKKDAENALIKEKERAEGYFELAGTALVVLGGNGEIMNINKKGCEMIGAGGKEEVLGLNWTDNFIPPDKRALLKQVQELLVLGGAGAPLLYENEVMRKDGAIVVVEWRNRRISAPDGGFHILSAGVDVTEKKQAEVARKKALQTTARQALELEELLLQAKNVIRHSGNFKETSAAIFESCRRMTGVKSGYVEVMTDGEKGSEVFSFGEGSILCTDDTGLRMSAGGLSEKACENRIAAYENDFMNSEWAKFVPAGSVMPKNALFAPFVIGEEPVGVMGLINKTSDFTVHDALFASQMADMAAIALHNSRIEQKLSESEAHFKSLVRNTPGIFFRCLNDREWTMLYISDAIEQLGGYKAEDLIKNKKRSYCSIIHHEDREKVAREIAGKLGKNMSYSVEYRIIKDSGDIRWVSEKGQLLKGDGQERIEGIILDMTKEKEYEDELVRAYDELRKLDRLKSNFVAIVSHELRTPVTVIKGFSSFLNKGIAGELAPKQKEFTEAIASNSARLEIIINDLIDVSKIEAGIMSITKNKCNLSKVVAMVLADMKLIAGKKNITLDPVIEDGITLNADAARIQQVVINLVNNAVKFSDAGSKITVALNGVFSGNVPPGAGRLKHPAGKYACLSVKDRGIGIEKENIKKIFERFYQIESADVRKHQGAGLGLNIAKNIIDMHEGHIWCESEGKGQGAVFYAVIPNE